MEEFERITLQIRERRMQEDPETKLGWYMRYVPVEDRDGYNDYRISLKRNTMIEESKEKDKKDQENGVKEKIEEEVDLNTFFN